MPGSKKTLHKVTHILFPGLDYFSANMAVGRSEKGLKAEFYHHGTVPLFTVNNRQQATYHQQLTLDTLPSIERYLKLLIGPKSGKKIYKVRNQ